MGKTIMMIGIILFVTGSIGYIALEIWLYFYRKRLKEQISGRNDTAGNSMTE